MSRCLAVIPARFPSSRLPGKPLKSIHGKLLIQRVYERACAAGCFNKVVIASDDERIISAARSFGAEPLLTSDKHLTGSDRVAEVWELHKARGESFDFVANVQGDLPFISAAALSKAVLALSEAPAEFGMSTIVTPITNKEVFLKPSAVKALLGVNERVLYFSRAPIPFAREEPEGISHQAPWGYKHMGLYVFRPQVLELMPKLQPTLPELREKLEQLRLLCNGVGIRAAILTEAEASPSIEVDTPEDLQAAIAYAQGVAQ